MGAPRWTSKPSWQCSSPSWVDETVNPTGSEDDVDSDLWAIETGGIGEDRVAGYSLVDLELVAVAAETGLLDITLDSILESSCTARFNLPSLAADATFTVRIEYDGEIFSEVLTPTRL